MNHSLSVNKFEYIAYFMATYEKQRGSFQTLVVSRDGFPTEKFCKDTINRVYTEHLDVVITDIQKL